MESKEEIVSKASGRETMSKSNLLKTGYGSIKSTCIGSFRGQTQKLESEGNIQDIKGLQKFKIYSNEQLSDSLS